MSSEWTEFEVGQVCNITSSKRIFAHEYVERGVPFYGSKEIIDKALGTYSGTTVFISDARFSEIAAKFGYPAAGDLLLSSVGNRAGIPYVIKDEGKFYFKDGNITWFKDFNGLDSHFLCYWMKSVIGQSSLNSIMIGSAQKALTITGLVKLRISLPPLQQQERIVAILNALDDRISLLRETNATLEAIAQALFKSWFVDFDPVRAKMEGRAPEGMDEATAALFPDSFEESALGLVPKGWPVGTLGDVAQTVRKQIQPAELHTELHYVGLEHMPRKSLSLINWGTADGLESAKAGFSDGDILFGKLRPYFHKVLVAPFDGVCSTDILVCQGKKPAYYGFAAMHLFSTALIDYAERLSNGAKMPRVGWKDIAAYPVIIPSEPAANAYTWVVEPMLARMKANVHEAKILATLRDTLLPRLISGQLRLPEAEAMLEEACA